MSARRLAPLLVLALISCRDRTSVPRPVPPPATRPEPAPTATPSPTTSDVVPAPSASGDGGTVTMEAAVRAATHGEVGTPAHERDIDGDGVRDVLLESAAGCVLARQGEDGWTAEVLVPEGADRTPECVGPVENGGRAFIVVTAFGHEVDQEGGSTVSYSWRDWAVFTASPGAPARRVFEQRIDHQGQDEPRLTFAPLGADALVLTANMDGARTPLYRVLRWDVTSSSLIEASCWQAARPETAPPPLQGCTARPAASFHLREQETSGRESSTSLAGSTSLTVLHAGSLRRGRARLHCVRTPEGAVGYAFVLPGELSGCPALP